MKRFVALGMAVFLTATSALALYPEYRLSLTTQDLDQPAPTLATEGILLDDVTGIQVTVSAPAGETIEGGQMICWYRSAVTARWMRCSAFDFTLGTAVRDTVSVSYGVKVGIGRLHFAANGVTLSGAGTSVQVAIEARVH